ASSQGLEQFLEFSILDKNQQDSTQGDFVTLITVHNTKGLEFPFVFVTGLEQGLFPRHDKTEEELEEERRLFYVAITRAKDNLIVTYRKTVYMNGFVQATQPSIFLKEIPKELLILDPDTENMSSNAEWQKGTKVYHDEYGSGWVKKIDDTTQETVILVKFENGLEKTFIPKYTKSLIKIKDY
ncbi:TPA: ATP-dependent helicase, partial [bacterium]|nr:ATP-dependent helicase [bacterium]